MEVFENILTLSNDILWSYILIALLITLGIYFTIRSGFAQFRFFAEMFKLLGAGARKEKKKGSVSTFQSFCISTASRVGTGNLAGVAIAIVMGGPGAIFWMWIVALIGGATSIVECTLAQIYKVKDEYGFKGGPAYYRESAKAEMAGGFIFDSHNNIFCNSV